MFKPPAWAEPYPGTPYLKGGRYERDGACDCIGLTLAVIRREAGIALPEYDGPPWERARDVKQLAVAADAFSSRFVEIEAGQEQVFDAICLSAFRQPVHCGVVVAPGWMLHIEQGCEAVIESYRGLAWKNKVVGFFRPQLKANA